MKKYNLLAATLILAAAGAVRADTVIQVAVNTSSLSGTSGFLDFQFDPSAGETQQASVQILNFTGGNYGGSFTPTDEIAGGPLPSPVTLGNGIQTGVNYDDYFESFTYGNTIKFTLDFSGPAVTSPNGFSTGDSTFAFSLLDNNQNPVLTSDPNGFAGTVAVNENGSLSSSTLSPNLQFVPEPTSLGLAALSLIGLGIWKRRK